MSGWPRLEEMDASLTDIAYAGVVFTMPRELWGIFRGNRHLLHDLPVLGASVIQHWVKTKYNANVLVMVVPHTFGGDLKFNTHLHILVSAGGLVEAKGRWLPRLVFAHPRLRPRIPTANLEGEISFASSILPLRV